MRLLKLNVFVFFLTLFPFFSFAQKEGFTRYTTKDGLLSDEIYNLHQDRQGYIWVFTNYGTLKYNSVDFKPVLKNLPFGESFIYCFFENKKGEKWAANSNAKIYRIVNDSAFVVKGTEAVSEVLRKNVSEIFQLHVDDSLNIYAISKRYCYKFINNAGTYRPFNLTFSVQRDSSLLTIIEQDGSLLPIFNPRSRETKEIYLKNFKIISQQGEHKIYSPYKVMNGVRGTPKHFKKFGDAVYFSFYNRLGKITKNKSISYTEIGSYIINFTKDKYGHTWVACLDNGIVEMDEHDSVIHHYLENITINDVLIDSQNGLWASSPGLGLFHYKNLNTYYFKENEPLSNAISFVRKLDDKLFVATAKGDVFLMENNTFYNICKSEENDIYKNGKPLSVLKFGSNYLISSVFSIKEISIDRNRKSRILFLKEIQNAFKIILVSKDSLVYLHRRGVGFVIKGELKKRVDLDFKTYDFEYRNKLLFIATDNGIRTHTGPFPADPVKHANEMPIVKDTLSQFGFLVATGNSSFKKIVKDKSNNLWFCSAGSGIFLLDSANNLSCLSTANGLPSNIVNTLSFTDSNSVLLCTNKGLFFSEFRPETPLLFKWVRIYNGNVEEAVAFAGRIYLATTNGLVVMDYDRIDQTEYMNFNLDAIYINSVRHNLSSLKEIKYNQNNLEFWFDIIHFTMDKMELKYRLSGPISDSGLVTGTVINLQNLPPGRYLLETIPSNAKDKKFRLLVPFYIAPAFWQTLSFFIFLGLFLALLVVVVVLLIFRNLKRKRDKKEQAERLISEYRLIALKAQINPHFMSNCLSAIQLLIINNKVDAATQYIAKFGLLVRQILNFSTRSLVTLSEELEISMLNMDLEQLRFENKFEYEISIDPKIDPKNVYVPALILNPIIENAIWHGLLPLKNSRSGKLHINVTHDLNMLLLIIEDNGVGRHQKKQNLSNSRQSKGIQLTGQRLSNINYLYGIETAKIIYSDLVAEDESPAGTRVTILLPLNLTPLSHE